MIRAVIALSLSAASAAGFAAGSTTETLQATSHWWEKVTVTLPPAGTPTCAFTSSVATTRECGVEDSPEVDELAAGTDQLTKVTFERRFAPGHAAPDNRGIADGETLLGAQMLKLAIDADGKVAGCNVVAQAGDMVPDYGCREAAAEKFAASAGEPDAAGYMTILVYAHTESMS